MLTRLLLTILLLTPNLVLAQASTDTQLQITPDTPVSSAQLQQWLSSGDPRLIAWAAYFARTTHDLATLDGMVRLLNDWPAPSSLSRKLNYQGSEAQRSVLDALIQSQTPVPRSTLDILVNDFPVQSLILAARLPTADSAPLLEQWYRYGSAGWPSRTTTRVAAMMLALAPPPEFASSIVRDSEESLTITVVTQGMAAVLDLGPAVAATVAAAVSLKAGLSFSRTRWKKTTRTPKAQSSSRWTTTASLTNASVQPEAGAPATA